MYSSSSRGFTLVELIVVIAIIGFLFSVVFASVSNLQRDAQDKHRIADLQQLQKALELYYTDYRMYPRELADSANGPITQDSPFFQLVKKYLAGLPTDPVNSETFHYYYDGDHVCGTKHYAVIFATQMSKPENANYTGLLGGFCSGIIDGEGRGGGTGSYNIFLGESSG